MTLSWVVGKNIEWVFHDWKLTGVDWSQGFLKPAAADLVIFQGTSALSLRFRHEVYVHLLYKASDVNGLAICYCYVSFFVSTVKRLNPNGIPKYSVFSVDIFITLLCIEQIYSGSLNFVICHSDKQLDHTTEKCVAFCKTSKLFVQILEDRICIAQRPCVPRGDQVINGNHAELRNIISWGASTRLICKSSTIFTEGQTSPDNTNPCKSKRWSFDSSIVWKLLVLFSVI